MSDDKNQKVSYEDSLHDPEYIPKTFDKNTKLVERRVTASLETPFLPPKFLEEYEKIVPGSSKAMFEMVVEQNKLNEDIKREEMALNRESLERAKKIDHANIEHQKMITDVQTKEVSIKSRGQIFAFILASGLICASCFFAYIDEPWLASLPIGTIIGVITVMFLQKKHNNQTIEHKDSFDE